MKKAFVIEASLLLLTLFIAPGDLRGSVAEEATFKVPEGKTEFSPKTQQIKIGTGAKWKNEDRRTHFLTAADPNRKEPARVVTDLLIHHLLPPGDVFEMKFDKPGRYDFFCAIHMEMRGALTVLP